MDMTLTAALGGAKAALDIIRIGVAARDDAKVQSALIDANMKLLDLSTAALGLSEKVDSLQSALRQAQNELRESKLQAENRESLTLTEVGTGAYAYASKPAEGEAVVPPYFCQPCYDQGIKSVLRRSQNGTQLFCSVNAAHNVRVGDDPPINYPGGRGRV